MEQRTFKRGLFQAVLLAAIMYASLGCYLFVLKWRGHDATVTTWTPVDEWLPFWPSWVWVYLIPYIVGPVLIGFMTRSTFWWYVRHGLVIVGITLCIFALFPTQTDNAHRGQQVGTGLTAEIYRHMIEIDDPPANAAPSLHVSLTCLLALALVRDFPRRWPLWLGFVGIVWLSTLVTRQHHLIDVATGALLTAAVVRIGSILSPRTNPTETQLESATDRR
jgi:membrane-associated phospholipid phosphatase